MVYYVRRVVRPVSMRYPRLLRLLRRRRHRRRRRRQRRRGRWLGGRNGRRHGGRHQAEITQEIDRPEFRKDIEQGFLLPGAADHARRRRAVLVMRDQRRGVRHLHVRVVRPQSYVHARARLQIDQDAVIDTRKNMSI